MFTEQGVYMLMTVLRGEIAIKQSREMCIRDSKKATFLRVTSSVVIGAIVYKLSLIHI